jgi:hypothetical protein
MPLDSLLLRRPSLLAELEPVPLEALEAHKRAQLERFAPSFWYQHQTWLPVGLIGSVGCMAASGGLVHSMAPQLSLGWLCVMTLLVVFGVFRVSAGAEWEERRVAPEGLDAAGVPGRIAAVARALCRETPQAALILGELKQQEVVLDPYLLLERDGERVCLGIWDGERVTAAAG